MQTPTVAVVEMMQCITQAMAVTVRKPASAKPSDLATAVLMQLPHFDGEVVKKLKRRKINTIKELGELGQEERTEAMLASGLTHAQVGDWMAREIEGAAAAVAKE